MGKRKFRLLRRRDEFQSHYTVLDIGTEFVKALVVKREEDKGIVLGVGKVRQGSTHMQAGAVSDIQSVIDNCDHALTEAEDMCETIPGQAVIGIAGEQVRGFSTTMTLPRPQPQARITQADLATAVSSGKDDALIADSPVSGYAVKQSGGTLTVVGRLYQAVRYGYVLPRDETDFGQALARALRQLMVEGTYAAILDKWGVSAGAISDPAVNPVVPSASASASPGP